MIDWFLRAWQTFAGTLTQILPASPTMDSEVLATIAEYAGYINYFIPVGQYLIFLSALLIAIMGYYAIMPILRLMKLIG